MCHKNSNFNYKIYTPYTPPKHELTDKEKKQIKFIHTYFSAFLYMESISNECNIWIHKSH